MAQVVSRRQEYKFWRVKDPASEVTVEGNLRFRLVDSRLTSDAVRARQFATLRANRLLARARVERKDPASEVTVEGNLRTRRAIGEMVAQQMRRRARASSQQASWAWRQNLWIAPADTHVYTAEVFLTVPTRSRSLTVNARGGLTLRTRTRSLTVGDR